MTWYPTALNEIDEYKCAMFVRCSVHVCRFEDRQHVATEFGYGLARVPLLLHLKAWCFSGPGEKHMHVQIYVNSSTYMAGLEHYEVVQVRSR